MENIAWFDRHPGSLPVNEEEGCLLFGGEVPDMVRLPDDRSMGDLAGQVVKVLGVTKGLCPVTHVPAIIYELEGDLFVSESDQFYWFRRK